MICLETETQISEVIMLFHLTQNKLNRYLIYLVSAGKATVGILHFEQIRLDLIKMTYKK